MSSKVKNAVVNKTNSAIAKNKAKKAKPVSDYKEQVLGVNSKLKAEQSSLGGAIKMLMLFRSDIGLDARRVKVLREMQKEKKYYDTFKKIVRTSKTGNYCAFYVLQALNKNLSQIETDMGFVKAVK